MPEHKSEAHWNNSRGHTYAHTHPSTIPTLTTIQAVRYHVCSTFSQLFNLISKVSKYFSDWTAQRFAMISKIRCDTFLPHNSPCAKNGACFCSFPCALTMCHIPEGAARALRNPKLRAIFKKNERRRQHGHWNSFTNRAIITENNTENAWRTSLSCM